MADHDTHDHTGVPGAGSPTEITDIPTAETDTDLRLAPDGAGGVEWSAAGGAPTLAYAQYRRTSGDYTTSSTSFVDIDGTNLNFSLTTGAHRVRSILEMGHVTTSGGFRVELLIDGVAVGGGDSGVYYHTLAANNTHAHIEVMSAVLSAGSHTFKWQWATFSGSLTMYGGTTAPATPLRAWCEETNLTT